MQADCSRERAFRKRWRLLSSLVSIFAIAVVSAAIYAVVDQYSPVLNWDQWSSYDVHALMNNLFAQHNEHRILIPRLFFVIDLHYFDGNNKFLLASSSIPSFYTTAKVSLNTRDCCSSSAYRSMRGLSLCSGMLGVRS
jgi:hypothetical protein